MKKLPEIHLNQLAPCALALVAIGFSLAYGPLP